MAENDAPKPTADGPAQAASRHQALPTIERLQAPTPATGHRLLRRTPLAGRLVNRDGTANIRRLGQRRRPLSDVYHQLLAMTWTRFLSTVVLLYLLSNALFAGLYYADPHGIENARPGSFADAFYFSVQTMATIGYGKMVPVTTWCHLLVTVQSLIGLLSTALMTGLMFAKFSRPTSRIVFSRVACISLRDGVPSLIFRVTNERGNQVAEAQLNVVIFRSETTSEGEPVRRFYDLPLWRQRSPIFALTWTAVHQILPGSELHGQTQASLQAVDAEVLVTFTGTDSTLAQPVHARHAYRVGDLRWNERFVDLFGIDEQGRRYVDYHQFHNTVPMADAAQVGQPSDPPATGT